MIIVLDTCVLSVDQRRLRRTTATMSDGSSDEEDYDAFEDADDAIERRYPLHDCVEFEDIEALRVSERGI